MGRFSMEYLGLKICHNSPTLRCGPDKHILWARPGMVRALTLRFSPNMPRLSSFACLIRKDGARSNESEYVGRMIRFGIATFQRLALDCCMVTEFMVHIILQMAFALIRTSCF